jgi:hypothetical protein
LQKGASELKARETAPPIWDGKEIPKRWMKFRREILAWMALNEGASHLGLKFWMSTPEGSPARALLDTIPDAFLHGDRGMTHVLQLLDRSYAPFLRHVSESHYKELFQGLPRHKGEDYLQYTTRFGIEVMHYETDERVRLPEKLKIRLLLGRAQLNQSQLNLLQSWCAADPDDYNTIVGGLVSLDDPRWTSVPGSSRAMMVAGNGLKTRETRPISWKSLRSIWPQLRCGILEKPRPSGTMNFKRNFFGPMMMLWMRSWKHSTKTRRMTSGKTLSPLTLCISWSLTWDWNTAKSPWKAALQCSARLRKNYRRKGKPVVGFQGIPPGREKVSLKERKASTTQGKVR